MPTQVPLRVHERRPRPTHPTPALTGNEAPYPTPTRPPAEWFERPDFLSPGQRLQVMPEGRIYGYLIGRDPVRLANGELFSAPRSPSGYTRARQGRVTTMEGDEVRVMLLGARGHPDDDQAYADPDRARALVAVGDDEHGVWIAGSLVPGTTYGDVAEMRRCSLSGDWRATEHGTDLVGAGLVVVPAAPLDVELHDAPAVATPPQAAAVADGVDLEVMIATARRGGWRDGVAAWSAHTAEQLRLANLQLGATALQASAAVECSTSTEILRRVAAARAVLDQVQADLAIAGLDARAAAVELPPA